MVGGCPEGTTQAAGYSVGMSGGCPEGTTLDTGYHVNICTNLDVDFSDCDLSTALDWDISSTICNINDPQTQTTKTQRALTPTRQICWQCGHVLWGDGSRKATYITDTPKGVQAKDAPANAFLLWM